jgi:uncharacterized membrane protein
MKKIFGFVKEMLIGGVLFFIPLIILVVILQKAFQLAAVVVGPIIRLLNVTQIFGIGIEIILSIAIILFIIYLGGLISKTAEAKKMVGRLEDALLSKVPGYEMIKNMGESFMGFEENTSYQTVIVRFDDAWQLAFLIEEIEGDQYAVYVPGSPNPMSGSVYIVEKVRIKKTNIQMKSAMKCFQVLGAGSNELVKNYL